ncbi:MAG: hypothetical protein V1644_01840 [Candidatus Micrarchaeota archaeon]
MRFVLLVLSLAAILALHFVYTPSTFAKIAEVEKTGGIVTVRGLMYGNNLCDGQCIKVVGVKARGIVTLTGSVSKKGGEVVLFAKRIE